VTREPLLSAAGVTAAVSAIIGVLAVFGFRLSADQTAAILAVVAVLAPFVVALLSRGKVTPFSLVAARRLPVSGDLVAGPAAPGVTQEGEIVDVTQAEATGW
jgi:hypothetical protein